MKLRVSLRAPGSVQASNIQITADATATVHDVAEALAGALGQDTGLSGLTLRTFDPVTGQPRLVSASTALIDSGIQSGAQLELSSDSFDRSARGGEAAALLRVVAGPDKGIEVPLLIGMSVIGRSEGCDVHLTDRRVSKRHARVSVGVDKIEIIDLNSSNGVLIAGAREARATLGEDDVVTIGDSEFVVRPLRARPRLVDQ